MHPLWRIFSASSIRPNSAKTQFSDRVSCSPPWLLKPAESLKSYGVEVTPQFYVEDCVCLSFLERLSLTLPTLED
jgi:hypothetical protein